MKTTKTGPKAPKSELEKLRKAKRVESQERGRLLSLERREREGVLVTLSEVQALYHACLLPIRQTLNSLPSVMCARCNPTDPDHARAALQEWVDGAVKSIRGRLPKPKITR